MKSKLHESSGKTARSAPAQRTSWLESLEDVLEHALRTQGAEHTLFIVDSLMDRLRAAGLRVPTTVSTPYINTIPVERQPARCGLVASVLLELMWVGQPATKFVTGRPTLASRS